MPLLTERPTTNFISHAPAHLSEFEGTPKQTNGRNIYHIPSPRVSSLPCPVLPCHVFSPLSFRSSAGPSSPAPRLPFSIASEGRPALPATNQGPQLCRSPQGDSCRNHNRSDQAAGPVSPQEARIFK